MTMDSQKINVDIVSEHYFPRLAGTATYVQRLAGALREQGTQVTILVPGIGATVERRVCQATGNQLISLPAGAGPADQMTNDNCRSFASSVAKYLAEARRLGESAGLLHWAYGPRSLEAISGWLRKQDDQALVVTIHNVPPHECHYSWPGDDWHRRAMGIVRDRIAGFRAERLIRGLPKAAIIVPSNAVKSLVVRSRSELNVAVIGHAPTLPSRGPRGGGAQGVRGRLSFLTLGGFVPHKQQHLIPGIARVLQARGLDFQWTAAGPGMRHPRYLKRVLEDAQGLGSCVKIEYEGVPDSRVHELYMQADLYIQPSKEEGFCITAWDACNLSVPLIGGAAGAIPEMVRSTRRGRCLPTDATANDYADAILEVLEEQESRRDGQEVSQSQFCSELPVSWGHVARATQLVYRDLQCRWS